MDIETLKDTVGKWLRGRGEVLAVARYSGAAISRDYALFSDHEDSSDGWMLSQRTRMCWSFETTTSPREGGHRHR